MSLKSLSELKPQMRNALSNWIPEDEDCLKEIEKGRPFFRADELKAIEENKDYKTGLTFSQIDEILSRKGMILKLPTFKKYVGMKLIPESIEIRKTKKGIIAVYPPKIIRAINFIKYSLYANLDFIPIIERKIEKKTQESLDKLRLSALELIGDPFDDWVLFDFSERPNNFNEVGETPPEAISRFTNEFFKKKVINKTKLEEINNLIDAIYSAFDAAEERFSTLCKVLDKIEVPFRIYEKIM